MLTTGRIFPTIVTTGLLFASISVARAADEAATLEQPYVPRAVLGHA